MAHNLNKRIKEVSMEKPNTFQYTSFHSLFWQENTRIKVSVKFEGGTKYS